MQNLLLITVFAFFTGIVNAQSSEADLREAFDEGVYFFNRGEYNEAVYYFRKLTEHAPDNSHYNFRVGECYLNIPGSETLAIPFFEKATQHTVAKNKYRSRDFTESNAPLHAWFYLGNVYRIGGKLSQALNAYNTFVSSPLYYGNYNINVVENEIKSCERAKIIMDSPVDVTFESLDSVINTTASELHPVVSADGQTLVFVRKLKFYDAIFYVTRRNGSWDQPVNLNPLIGSDGEFYPVSLSGDGQELYLVRTADGNQDIYVSFRRNDTWTRAERLNRFINTMADESWACISADGKTLWFTSTRKGGQGGADIYYSNRDNNNQWGRARNAGKIINTPFDEASPCLADQDRLLFFSSKGHYSMGGFDIFYTTKNGKTWKDPVNIGFPVNNTSDNLGYSVTNNGRTGYCSVISAPEEGLFEDIYRVILNSNYPLP